MKHSSSLIASVIVAVTLAIPVSADPVQVQKTDAEAGCQYGTQAPASFTPTTYPRSYTAVFQMGDALRPSTECNLLLAWVPFARSTTTLNYTYVSSDQNNSAGADNYVCVKGAADPNCDPAKWEQLITQSASYHCTSDAELNCVSSIDVIDESGKVYPGTFVREFPKVEAVPASVGYGATVPAGGGSPLWSVDLPSGPLTVLTNGVINTNWQSSNGKWTPRGGVTYRMTLFGVNVAAQSGIPKPEAALYQISYNGKTVNKFNHGPGNYGDCLTIDTGECAREVTLPSGYRYRVTMQLPEGAALFLNGRLSQPTAYTEPLSGGYRFVLEAAPAEVLAVADTFPKALFTRAAIDAALERSRRGDNWVYQRSNADNFSEGGSSEALIWLNLVLPLMKDRASWVSNSWTVSTTGGGPRFGAQCESKTKNSFIGIVSSNATAYTGEPPVYNTKTATLEYEVSAPHYLPDGKTAATGVYALNLNADFVQCLLGVSKVPDQASVQLTYGDGEVNAGTINVRQTKNWLTLIAANFHFSSPKINVSFAQAIAPAVKPEPPKKLPPKTITCVKGKTSKKIAAAKCPSGYKRKS